MECALPSCLTLHHRITTSFLPSFPSSSSHCALWLPPKDPSATLVTLFLHHPERGGKCWLSISRISFATFFSPLHRPRLPFGANTGPGEEEEEEEEERKRATSQNTMTRKGEPQGSQHPTRASTSNPTLNSPPVKDASSKRCTMISAYRRMGEVKWVYSGAFRA